MLNDSGCCELHSYIHMSLGFGSPNRYSDKIIKEDTAVSFSTRVSLEVYLTIHTSIQTLKFQGSVIKQG